MCSKTLCRMHLDDMALWYGFALLVAHTALMSMLQSVNVIVFKINMCTFI